MAVRLAIDLGNTALKWALVAHDGMTQGSVVHRARPVAAVLADLPTVLRDAEQVGLVSVAGEDRVTALSDWLGRAPTRFLAGAQAGGVRNAYAEPGRLGADRWAAMVAVQRDGHAGTLIVGCGSAVTFDALRADGQHLGGYILPGLAAMRGALASGTHAVQVPDTDELPVGLGRDTASAVGVGLRRSIAGLAEDVLAEVGGAAAWQVVLTGGDAPRLEPWFRRPVRLVPDLVLRGVLTLMDDAGP